MPTPIETISLVFYNCVHRKCTKEQLHDFLNREKQRWNDPEILSLLESLESEIREEEVA